MIKNKDLKLSFWISFLFVLLFHLVVLFFVKKPSLPLNSALTLAPSKRVLKIDFLKNIPHDNIEQLKRVGIKNGSKEKDFQPDMLKIPKKSPISSITSQGPMAPPLLDLSTPKTGQKSPPLASHSLENNRPQEKNLLEAPPVTPQADTGNIYFNPKQEKIIHHSEDQDNFKQEAFNNNTASSSHPVAQKMSNFEIRYERPEGVSEDELNSDEKAYYSFFKRSYANYLSKLYATYDRIAIERPGLQKDFMNKHSLLAKIDYDEKGNIILIKILKSSSSDDVHYFFEETLKQLNLPNPPKIFIKNKKQFSTYYQIQIN